jgi:hypothetical protein
VTREEGRNPLLLFLSLPGPLTVTLEELLKRLPNKDDTPIACPFHAVKKPDGSVGQELFASFWINKEKQVFHCFGCGEGGSFIKLKARLEGLSYEEAKWELYGNELPPFVRPENSRLRRTDIEEETSYPVSSLAPYRASGGIPERGITDKGAEVYSLLLDGSNNLLIPYFDRAGKLRGLQVRRNTADESTNWYDQVLHFRRGQWLFGEQLSQKATTSEELQLSWLETLQRDRIAIICEGALDAVKLYDSLGVPSLAVNGSSVTSAQLETLSKLPVKRLVWWRDNDATGKLNLNRNYRRLSSLVAGEVYTPVFSEGDKKDPCEMSQERIKELWMNRVLVSML